MFNSTVKSIKREAQKQRDAYLGFIDAEFIQKNYENLERTIRSAKINKSRRRDLLHMAEVCSAIALHSVNAQRPDTEEALRMYHRGGVR